MELKLLQVKESSGEKLNSPWAIADYMIEEAKADRECMWVLHLNNSNMLIEKELISIGTINASMSHPREIFKKAILNGSRSIATVHNHPGGKLKPSESDIEIWERIEKGGEILGIIILDNIIVTPSGGYHSKKGNDYFEP